MNLSGSNFKKILITLCTVVLFYEALENINNIISFVNKLIVLVFPFLLGGAMAFIINVPMRKIEKQLFKKSKYRKIAGVRRGVALVTTIIAFVFIIFFALKIVIPEITDTVIEVSEKLPGAFERFSNKLEKLSEKYPEVEAFILDVEVDWGKVIDVVASNLKNGAGLFLSSGIGIISSLISGVASFVIGLVFAIYILIQKEKLANQAKQVLYAFLSKEKVAKIINVCTISNKTFSSFLSGQCLEACILGLLFFVTMSIIGLPYALMMGVVIAITALIPIVGAFIGCFIGAILILIDSPMQALVFVIMFLILQQIEGNLIYPYVVGNSVGLPSIWVLVAVTIGGNLMGVLGMIIFIPICSIAYALFRELVKKRLAERNIKVE